MSNIQIPKMPEIKATKSGYEIRARILHQAQELVAQEFKFKWQGWEMSQQRDKDGNLITKVDMPEVPGLEHVLNTAEKMYSFVNASVGKK
jgi:hypothetical protein